MEITQRKRWNRTMGELIKRRGLVSTVARRWIDLRIRQNEARIAEIREVERCVGRAKWASQDRVQIRQADGNAFAWAITPNGSLAEVNYDDHD